MVSLDQRRFLFVTGKGGAGKTTVSAALALSLSARGRRVLLATSGAKERISPLFAGAELGTRIEPLADRVWGVLLTPEVALREYGALVLKSPKLVDALFDNKYVEGFFNGAPGLREWALLGKAWYHATELSADGSPRFDTVVFDAPATGHGLDMLRVPQVILAAAPPGRLRTDAERALAFLRDPSASGVVVVSLPEEMPTNETLELVHSLRADLGLPVAEIVLNAALSPLFDEREEKLLAPLAELAASSPGEAALVSAARRALSERTQSESVARLSLTGLPLRKLPRLEGGAGDYASVLALSSHLG